VTILAPMLALAIGTYVLRLAGFLLTDVAIPRRWERAIGFVPVAVLTSLIISTLVARPDEWSIRLVALVGGAVIAWRTGRAWTCIVGGMLIYWLLRFA
jgi:branched-subunit amino acid transport protein